MLYIKDLSGKNRTTLKVKYTVTELLNEAPLYAGFVNLYEVIEKMTVYRWNDGVQSHWEIILQTQTEARIKLDITQEYYRLLYGAEDRISSAPHWLSDRLFTPPMRTFHDVFYALLKIAIKHPMLDCSFNCQTFVVEFMKYFGMSTSQIFKYELIDLANRKQVTYNLTHRG